MNYCNHYCQGFRFDCPYRTFDGYCTISQCISYSDHTDIKEVKRMNPNELIRTQKGARLYWLWGREKNPQKKQKYQEEFNKLLEGDKNNG